MLGPTYRIVIKNDTGVSITCTAFCKRMKFDSDGAAVFEGSEATLFSSAAVGAGGSSNGSTIDNTTDKYLFADIEIEAISGSSATGNVTFYLDRSTDGGTTWGTVADLTPIGGFYFASETTTKRVTVNIG